KIGWYLPPEARNGGVCKEAGDMWMLGVLAWQVLTGPLPQPGMSQEAGWATVMLGKPSFKSAGWASRSPEAVDFVSRLVQKDVARRMTAAEALEHPWLRPNRRSAAATAAAAAAAAPSAAGNDAQLSSSIRASLLAFKESCVMRRVGLRLVGRTLQAARLPPVKQAFRLLDPCGKGYITQDAVAEGLRGAPCARSMNGGPATSTDQTEPSDTASRPTGPAAAAADTVEVEDSKLAREIFEAMDAEGSGRVGFSAFLAACLAGRPADEAGARVTFSWLDRRGKGAINAGDLKLVTGDLLSRQELEDAFSDGHDALDLMSASSAGPVGAAMRDMEARKSAASGAAGGFTYAEFYRLLAWTPPSPESVAAAAAASSDSEDEDDGGDDDPLPYETLTAAAAASAASPPKPAPPFSERVPTMPAADGATSVGERPMVAAAAKKKETVAAAGSGGVVDDKGDEEIVAPGIETEVVAATVAGAAAVGTSVVGRASTSRSG
ncbi:unnamed protein product, partial [Ectocarpus sp. 4 AP-2014]